MKKEFIIIVLVWSIVMLSTNYSWGADWTDRWTINGIKVSDFKNAWGKEPYVIAGMVTSLLVHCASHHVAAAAFNVDMYQEGLYERTEYVEDRHARQWIARAGFFGQNLVGSLLNVPLINDRVDPYFTLGYNTMSLIEVTTYPIRWPTEGDFVSLNDAGGDPAAELSVYTFWSLLNLNIRKEVD